MRSCLGSAGVHGALLGGAEIIGVSVTLPDNIGDLIRSIGENTLTHEYLSELSDGATYLNIGLTTVPDDLPRELLDRKIASYYNIGETIAPAPLLALLKARCPQNLGEFKDSAEEKRN